MEPSPYEVTSLLTIFVFVCTGLALRPALMPLFVLLLLYNTGFSLAVVQITDADEADHLGRGLVVPVGSPRSSSPRCCATNTAERLSLLMRGIDDGGGVRLAARDRCPISACSAALRPVPAL